MKKILVVQKRDEMKKICWREKYFHQHILLLDIYLAIQKNYYLVSPIFITKKTLGLNLISNQEFFISKNFVRLNYSAVSIKNLYWE